MDNPFRTPSTRAAFLARIGEELGTSDWYLIDQARIDAFAEVTEDRGIERDHAALAAKLRKIGWPA